MSLKVQVIYLFQYEKDNHPKLSQICSQGIFSWGLKNEFGTAVVNKPSVFEPLKFNCTMAMKYLLLQERSHSNPVELSLNLIIGTLACKMYAWILNCEESSRSFPAFCNVALVILRVSMQERLGLKLSWKKEERNTAII